MLQSYGDFLAPVEIQMPYSTSPLLRDNNMKHFLELGFQVLVQGQAESFCTSQF